MADKESNPGKDDNPTVQTGGQFNSPVANPAGGGTEDIELPNLASDPTPPSKTCSTEPSPINIVRVLDFKKTGFNPWVRYYPVEQFTNSSGTLVDLNDARPLEEGEEADPNEEVTPFRWIHFPDTNVDWAQVWCCPRLQISRLTLTTESIVQNQTASGQAQRVGFGQK
jgi:hypothetical protein